MKFTSKILPIVLIVVLGCTDREVKTDLENTKAELETIKQELKNCKEKWVEERRNSPEQRFLIAKKLFDNGNYSESKKKYEQIIAKFPNTDYAKTASKELADMDGEIKRLESIALRQKAEDERKKALGFKILKPTSTVKFDDLSIRFEKVWIGKRWSFDDHGSKYSLRDATRGNKHVLARISVSSESKNPDLPPILVYQYFDGKLLLLGPLGYEFRRWKDYGSYLGNYADYGNDFAHSKTIPFNLGYETSEGNLKSGRVYVIMRKVNCFTRKKKDYGRPEIEYQMGLCAPKSTLDLSDFDNDYVLIKTL